MQQIVVFFCIVISLFVLMLALMEIGRRAGVRRRRQEGEAASDGLGTFDGAVFGLMGLLVAFTFSGATERFYARRHLIIQETNAIGTAYLRIDLLPAAAQPTLRDDFRNYVDTRLAYYRTLHEDSEESRKNLERVTGLQGKIWSEAVAACEKARAPATPALVLGALNEMIDITTTRAASLEMHPPKVVFWALGILVLASALLAGYGTSKARTRAWLHMLLYSGILAMAVYLILDLEYPRVGLIRIEATDHFLVDLRASMK